MRSLPTLAALALATACSSNPPPPPPPVDSGADSSLPDSSTSDAADAATGPVQCDPTKPYGTATAVTELNTGSEGAADLSADELTVYFGSTRAGGAGATDIWMATRATTTAPFANITDVPGVNGTGDDDWPRVSQSDGLTMVLGSSRNGSLDLFVATRASTSMSFGAPAAIAGVNGPNDEYDPYLSPDESELSFASNRSGDSQVYMAAKGSTGFASPAAVPGIHVPSSQDRSPLLSHDQLTLFFTSNRPGGTGGLDVWSTTRATTAAAFGTPAPVTELNTADDDVPAWISVDGCRMWISRQSGSTANLYVAQRPPK